MNLILFLLSLTALLLCSGAFTRAAVQLGTWFRLNPFVIGIFIVGIGTSLPEMISGITSVQNGRSEILSGNIIGANLSNLLLVTGLAVILNRKSIELGSRYIYTNLHFLLGSFFVFVLMAYDGNIQLKESVFGFLIYTVYSIYLIKGEKPDEAPGSKTGSKPAFPLSAALILLCCAFGVYISANLTIRYLVAISISMHVPDALVSLTLLSLGTTLPEIAVNYSSIRQGRAEMAIGNILGSCVFNALVIPFVAGGFGEISVSKELLDFSLPVMAASGLFFYLLTHDKKISPWEGSFLILLYALLISKILFP